MKYRLELKDQGKEIDKVWTDSFWLALEYLLEQVPSVHDSPVLLKVKSKLFRGRKLLAEIKHRKGWYPYFLKVHKGLNADEYGTVKQAICWNILHNDALEDKQTGTTKVKDWHEYLTTEKIV